MFSLRSSSAAGADPLLAWELAVLWAAYSTTDEPQPARTAEAAVTDMSFKKSLRLIFMFFSFSSTKVLFFKKLSFYAADVDALGKIFLDIGINDQNRDDRADDDCIGQAVC